MKKWINPELTNLSLSKTENDVAPLSIPDDYKSKVKCLICNKVFNTGLEYNAHLQPENKVPNSAECNTVNHNDGIVQEIAQVLIS